MQQDRRVLTVRLNCPAELSEQVQALLRNQEWVSSMSVMRGASAVPVGDLIFADIPRESANELIEALRVIGIEEEGTIAISDAQTWISRRAFVAQEHVPGAGNDSVVWADVTERAYTESALSWTYVSFMVLATVMVAIAIVTDSVILVIGGMVLGPEFVAVAALGLALVRKRPKLFKQASRTLVIGFAISIAAAAAFAVIGRLVGLITLEQIDNSRPGTSFIYSPNIWVFLVAIIAGVAGVLALTSTSSGALIGVFISVTTIPASGDAAISIVFGLWREFAGSMAMLIINITGMALAGWVTLAIQQRVWNRVRSRQGAAGRLRPTGQ